ncbi:hypothetical protein SAMN05444005_101623 [Flavobacterium urocaniciphilum]|uniref:Uncharacterized protein n=2 Tax=Flavobacterium urocaniciphilum TaxID=1299341 RepID=A0A1H8ZC81_9FLAO|nr:hypothetical protein SAMN05444005_101623 [Flavobacterium urocaniciphilum]
MARNLRAIFIMKKFLFLLLFSAFCFSQDGLPHCGFDFTTYLVANPIDATTKKTIDSLTITLIDASGNEVVNLNNQYSFINKDKTMNFVKNHKVKLENSEEKWFYNICEDQYLLQLKADFIPEEKGYSIKITDPLNRYYATIVPVFNNNLFVLCTTKVKSFGPKMTNNMIVVELNK